MKGRIAVIGGGSAGVGAAWEAALRGWDVLLLEKESAIGGLGRSVLHNGNHYDLGTHIFHSDSALLLDRVRGAAAGHLVESRQKIRIRWAGRSYAYPLAARDLAKTLPLRTLVPAGLSFLKARVAGPRRPASAEEQLIRDYGEHLYRIFFKTYTERHWGIPAGDLDVLLVRNRILRTDLFGLLSSLARRLSAGKASGAGTDAQPVASRLFYTAEGSGGLFSLLQTRLEELGVMIRGSCDVTGLEYANGRVTHVLCRGPAGEEALPCDAVVSTLPLDRLAGMLYGASPAGEQETRAGDGLDVRSLIVSGLLLNRPEILDANFIYFQDALFGRVSEPRRVGLRVEPGDHSILLCEVACSRGDERWRHPDRVTDRVIRELVRHGCARSTAEVVDRVSIPVPLAYPVYRRGFSSRVDAIRERLGRFPNLFSAGRWGEFRYINMHVAMLSGMQAAERADALLSGPPPGRAQGHGV